MLPNLRWNALFDVSGGPLIGGGLYRNAFWTVWPRRTRVLGNENARALREVKGPCEEQPTLVAGRLPEARFLAYGEGEDAPEMLSILFR